MIPDINRTFLIWFVLLALLSLPGCGANSGSVTGNNQAKDSIDTFSGYYNVSKSAGDSDNPVIAFGQQGQIYVLWEDKTPGKEGIYFSSSTGSNNNILFRDPVKTHLGSDENFKSPRVVLNNNGAIFVAYTGPDPTFQGGETYIYLAYSYDQGVSFSRVSRVLSRLDGKDARSASIIISPKTETTQDLFVVWVEGSEGSGELVYAAASSGYPQSISTLQNIWDVQEDQDEPLLGFDEAGNVYASWSEGPLDGFEGTGRDIYFQRDVNSSQQERINISTSEVPSNHPVLSCPGSLNILLVWEEGTSPNREVYYTSSINGGKTFSPPKNLSNTPQMDSYDPHITCGISGSVYMAWTEVTEGNNNEIYFSASYDWGDTFASPRNISQNSGSSDTPKVGANPFGDLLVAWSDTTSGNRDIFVAGSQDSGISFTAPLNLSDNTGSSISPVVGWNGIDQFGVAWVDDTWNNNKEIVLRTGGWVSISRISTPRFISPRYGSKTLSRPFFYWDPVSGATRYQIQVDDQADFSSPIIDQEIPANSFRPPLSSKLPPGIHYVRVRAMDDESRWTGYPGPNQFRVDPPQDVDGDGFSDILIGAPGANNATGALSLYFGPTESDIIPFQGEGLNDQFGSKVAIAGDLNGDGLDDLLVGAPFADGPIPYIDTGRTYLYISPTSGSPFLSISGSENSAEMGWAVTGAGDINGDGCSDFLAGAPGGSYNYGEAFLFFGGGKSCAFSSLDMTPDLIFNGPTGYSQFGYSLGTAGDVNGNGYEDFIIAAPRDLGGIGTVNLYFGGEEPDNIPDLILIGEKSGDLFGESVASAGDVNLDGFDDILIGAKAADGGRGKVYLYFGGPSMDDIPDIVIQGENSSDWFGYAVTGIGDVDGDGYEDILISAPFWDNQESYLMNAGRVHFFSGASLTRNEGVILSTSSADVQWEGENKNFYLGSGISGAGDFNGDGLADFLIGRPFWKDETGRSVGQAYLFYGSESTPIDTTEDIVLKGDTPSGLFGSALDKRRME